MSEKDKERVRKRLYWRCRGRANGCAWFVSAFIAVLLLAGLIAGFGIQSSNPILGWMFIAGSGVLILLTLGNLIFGAIVKGLHQRVQNRCLTWFIKREAAAVGLELGEE